MWTYVVKTGLILKPNGKAAGTGYSGNGSSLNNPAAEGVKGHGPIPKNRYRMVDWHDDPGGKGPIVCHLVSDTPDDMMGRDGFMIHGDNPLANHTGSDGCIVAPRFVRLMMRDSADQELEVIDEQDW